MNASTKSHEIERLLESAGSRETSRRPNSWLAKARPTGSGPRYVKVGRSVRYTELAVREYIKIRLRGSTSEY